MPFKRRYRKMRRRFKRRGRKMFRGRRFRKKKPLGNWGGALKFSSRFPGGNRATQVPLPDTYFTKHPFYQTQNVNIVGGSAFDLQIYNPSSLFNVDLAGADAGFAASMNLFYRQYVVLGTSYHVTVMNLDTTNSMTTMIVPFGHVDDPTSFSDMEYRAGCVTKVVSCRQGNGGKVVFNGYVPHAAVFGTKIWNELTYWGENTTNPLNNICLYIGTARNDAATTWVYEIRVHLTMYVKWFNRKEAGEPTLLGGDVGLASALPASKAALIKHLTCR